MCYFTASPCSVCCLTAAAHPRTVPPYPIPRQQYFTSKDTAALAGRYDPNLNGFRATAERTGFGADGRPQYRFGGVGAASTVPTSATGRYVQTNTLGSSGLPPVPYKVRPTA